ncbi:MAG: transaldolase family protein, partial [Solirubrobacteraceae bacterium]
AGLANARAAYAAFRRVFGGERFAALREVGCPVQRPLWASTGVKSSSYPEAMYVDGLVGPDTAITMPQPTLLAAGSAATIDAATVERDPTADLDALASAGIDLDEVTDCLLEQGVQQFEDAMATLFDGIEHRRETEVPGRPTTIEAHLPAAAREPVAETVRRAGAENVARRIWERDGTLWAPEGTPEVDNRLGWLTIADKVAEERDMLKAFVDEVRADGYTDAVVLGMGGSSLAPEVFRRSHSDAGDGGLHLHVLDTTEPLQVLSVEHEIDLERTLFVVSSKSGGTIEPNSLFAHFWALRPEGRHFVAVTDADTSLGALAAEHDFRRTFVNHPDIGGRYSALSWFGVVPAALAGIDVEGQLHAAEVAEQNCQHWQTPDENSGLWLGCALGALAGFGRDKLAFVIDPPIEAFGLWAEQLIAESTGKDGKGILPIADEPLVDPQAYGDDRVFVHVRNADDPDASHHEAVAALARAGHPTITVGAHGAADLGRLFFHSEFATAVAGWALGINPFDQPNVQEAKDNTSRVLSDGAPEDLQEGDLAELLEDLHPPHYLAVMGYLPYGKDVNAAVSRLRAALIERHGVATTWGYGPRFLHSTGQYHKGGPQTGRFLQLVHDDPVDADVPGQPFGFRQLVSAQADGDLETLRFHGLPAVRVRLAAGDLAGSIDRITAVVAGG